MKQIELPKFVSFQWHPSSSWEEGRYTASVCSRTIALGEDGRLYVLPDEYGRQWQLLDGVDVDIKPASNPQ